MDYKLFESYKSYIIQDLGASIAPQIDALIEKPSIQSLRINHKKFKSFVPNKLVSKIEGIEHGYTLNQENKFAADPLWNAGYYYVQEASSMVIGELVKQLLPVHAAAVLDLCAAPGGKSTHITSILRPNDFLLANEVVANRTPILYENLSKFGFSNFAVSSVYADQLAKFNCMFDIIVCDAPCSGEGLFRKQNDSIKQWSPQAVEHCSLRQQKIVEQAWNCLKPGGFLIYSTCTINSSENEKNVHTFIAKHNAQLVTAPSALVQDFISIEPNCYRKPATATTGEPFFFAILQKKGDLQPTEKPKTIVKPNPQLQPYYVINKNEHNYLLNVHQDIVSTFYPLLQKCNYPGNLFGKQVHNSINYAINLALLIEPVLEFESIELNKYEIIQYLKSEAYRKNLPQKYLWVNYNGLRIGMLKKAGNFYNNVWPKNWRIVSTHIQQAQSLFA